MMNVNKYEIASKLAIFLLDQTGSIYGTFKGTMKAAQQKDLFGAYRFGKRSIRINGATEKIHAVRTLCFGTDFECETLTWGEL